MFDKAVIHLGAHKTGTTHLQSWLRINQKGLNSLGISVPARTTIQPFSKAAYKRIAQGKSAQVPQLFETMVLETDPKISANPNLVLSDEDLLGLPNLGRTKTIYPKVGQVAQALVASIPAQERLWLFTVRDLASFIQSSYVQQLKMGGSQSIEHYLGKFNPVALDWADVISKLLEATPKSDRVAVCFYDGFRTNQKIHALLKDFFGSFPLPKEQEGVSNPGYNLKGINLARAANAALEDMRDRRKMRAFIQENFSLKKGESAPELLSPVLKSALQKQSEASLENIRAMKSNRLVLI